MKKKYLTRKKTIELCIELWTWLAKTGKDKIEWPDWKKYEQYYSDNFCDKQAVNSCWFCEYTDQRTNRHYPENVPLLLCEKYCPLFKQIGYCTIKTYFRNWVKTKSKPLRKKYARLFLKQIKSLRVK